MIDEVVDKWNTNLSVTKYHAKHNPVSQNMIRLAYVKQTTHVTKS